MRITVGIKALNEEAHIAAAIASALAAVAPFDGEVILADSGSSDRTIEIAGRYPVRIVQLANRAERSCGAGAQLAFQHAQGDYFYLLDGDMVLDRDFLRAGLAFLEANPTVAAVGGRVRQCNVEGEEFQIRAESSERLGHWQPGPVDRLDCGGLYRSAAVVQAGYFADRNLHAFEEFELAARLAVHGWTLARIDHPAVDHFGHDAGGYRLLWRRIRSGYAGCVGEVLRGAIGRDHLGVVLRRLTHVWQAGAVILWWLLTAASPFVSGYATVLLLAAPLAALAARRRSLRLGLYSLAQWNVIAWGLISGFLRRRVPPTEPLRAVQIATGEPTPRLRLVASGRPTR